MATVELVSRENNILRVTVAFDAAEVDKQFQHVYRELSNSLRLPGFRKGKIPANIIRQRVGVESLAESVEEHLREQAVDTAIEQLKVLPRKGRSEWHDEPTPVEGQPLKFEFSFPVLPAVKLPDYQAFEFTLPKLEVTDAMKQRFYDRLRDRMTEYPVKETPIATGDAALLRMSSTFVDTGEASPLAQDMMLYVVGKEGNLPGWDEHVLGATAGDVLEFTYTMPEDFNDPQVVGKPLQIRLEVKTVHDVNAPVLDDAYVKEHFKVDTLAEYDTYVIQHLTQERDSMQAQMMRDMVIQKMLEGLEAEITEDMVEGALSGLVEESEREAKEHESTLQQELEQSGKSLAEYRESLKPVALNRLKLMLVVRTLAAEKDLRATVSDFERYAMHMAQRQNITPKQFKELLGYPEFVNEISQQIMQEKVLDYLVGCAKFTTAGADEPGAKSEVVPPSPAPPPAEHEIAG